MTDLTREGLAARGLRIVMVTADPVGDIEDGTLNLSDEPTVILQGPLADVKRAGGMFGETVILATPAALAASPDLQELLREARAEGMERAADIADPISIEAAEAIRAAAATIRKGEKS